MSIMSSFVRAHLQNSSFLEVYPDDVIINVSHSQGDGICLNADIDACELQKMVDPYLAVIEKDAAISSAESMLGRKLNYFLQIYDWHSVGKLSVKCQSHGGSFIDSQFYMEDLELCDANYLSIMAVHGSTLIGRHFLEKFIKIYFNDFLEYVSTELSKSLHNAYQTISDASMNMYEAQVAFSYSRKINNLLTLKILIQEDAYGETFNPSQEFCETQEEAFDYALTYFESIANGKSIPALANLKIVDQNGEDVFSFSRTEYFKQVDEGFKFCDRACFIIEALSDFREQCVAQLAA
jgi:hypothetical protein